jgi:ABC-type lipoprotein release transport system permease subunit
MVRNSVGLFSGHISGVELPISLSAQTLKIPGIAAVLKRTEHRGLLQHETRFSAVILVAGVWAEEAANTALEKKIVLGKAPGPGQSEILLSQAMAKDLGLAPGDIVNFRATPDDAAVKLVVTGVYHTGIEQLDRALAFIPENILPESGTWSAAVFLKDGVEPGDIVAQYKAYTGQGGRFETWAELMPDLRQLIELNYVSMTLVTCIVFALVALGVASAFVIFILKNLREFGIVKAMGVGPWENTFLIAMEVLLLNFFASSAGLLLGVVAVGLVANTGIDMSALTSHNRYFAVSGLVIPRLTAYSLGLPPAVALLFSLSAAIWPALLVVRSKTSDILRAV